MHFKRKGGRGYRPPTSVKLEWLLFYVVSKYRQYVISFRHKARMWRTDRQSDRITTPKTALALLSRAVKRTVETRLNNTSAMTLTVEKVKTDRPKCTSMLVAIRNKLSTRHIRQLLCSDDIDILTNTAVVASKRRSNRRFWRTSSDLLFACPCSSWRQLCGQA